MYIVTTRSGNKVFFDTLQKQPDGSVAGTKKSKDGKIGQVEVPAQAVDNIQEWDRNPQDDD